MNWWRFVVAAEIRKILAFRSDFWITFIGQAAVQLLIARALWENIFESTGQEVMEGYTLPMMTLYYLIVPLGNKMLTGQSDGFLSREIYDGTFNKYLIYPLSFFQYKTLTYLTNSAFYGLQLALVFLVYTAFQVDGLTPQILGHLFLGLGIYLLASYTYAMIAMTIELISLWADNIWSLMVMCRFFCFFLGGSFVPLAFFPETLRSFLKFTPFPYLISLPVRTIMGLSNFTEVQSGVLTLGVWSCVFLMSAKLLWARGQYRYNGVGV